ncbi:MAG: prepilin-type N-terminal cleavage/methylation domain-containing protein [Burkholderiaceae bacterium]|nr:prepilin-type N-terminal cleavage/methylation domain-containing protein [Burkholderiaceae bacterium]
MTRFNLASLRNAGTTRRQRGISLLELIAGLAIIAIIIIGALALISQADASARSTEMLRGVSGIQASVIGLGKSRGSFGGGSAGDDLTAAMIRAKAIPDNWVKGSGSTATIRHSYGGEVTLKGYDIEYRLTLSAVPAEACIRLIAEQAGSGWNQVKVGSDTTVTFPATLGAANTACSTSSNSMVFVGLLM